MSQQAVRQPWYNEGLRFTCTQCGDCCTGEEGFVWVNEVEIRALAIRLDLDETKFRQRFTRQVGKGISLQEAEGGNCVFWSREKGCTVYEDRPRQCRSWPFWNSNVRTRKDWEETMSVCPGAGRGQLFTVEEIIERTKWIPL